MYKLVGAVAVLVIVCVVGLLAAPFFIDWNAHRDSLEAALREATGLDVDIAGDLDITFLPAPRVNARDVTWMAGPAPLPSVAVPEVRAFVALGDLIGGDLRVTDLALAGPRAVVVLDSQGRPVLSAPAGGAAASDAAVPVFRPDRVQIRGGTLTLERQGAADSLLVVESINGTVTTSPTSGRISLKGDGQAGAQAVDYTATLGRIRPGKPTPLRWSLGLAESGVTVVFNGALEGAAPEVATVGRIEIDAQRLDALFDGTALPLGAKADGSAKLEGEVRLAPDGIALSDMEFSADGARATGTASVAFGRRPNADLDLAFSRINVDRFAAGETADVAAGVAELLGGLAGTGPSRLPEGFTLRLRATADAMQMGGSVVHDAGVSVELDEGTLFVEQASLLLPGGSDLALNGVLEPREEGLAFDGAVAVSSDNLRALMDWVGVDTGRVPPARLRALELTGTLRSGPGYLALEDLGAQLDATRARGRVSLGLGETPRVEVDLAVDSFSVDAYRLRDRKPTGTPAPERNAPDPLGLLAAADGDIRLAFDRLTVFGQSLERVALAGAVSAGSIDFRSVQVADFAGISLDGSVTMSTVGGRPQIGLEMASRTRDPERLLRHLGLYPTAASRRLTGATLDVRGEGDFDLVTFSAEAGLAGGSIVIDGGVADPFGSSQLTADIQASHPTPVQLVRALGLPGISAADTQGLVDGGMLRMTAQARAAADSISIDIVSLSIGDAEIAGQANLALAAARPELDLVIIGGEISGAAVLAALASVQRATDVTLDLEAERLKLGPMLFDNASARATMSAGGAVIGPVQGDALGGSVELSVTIGNEAGQDLIEGRVAATNVDPGDLLQALGGPAAISGSLDLGSQFTARGRTVTEYLASLSGRAELDGTVRIEPAQQGGARYASGLLGENLPPIQQVTDLSQTLESAFGRQAVPVSAVFSVTQGVARTEKAVIAGTGAQAVSYGTWDIPGQRLETTIDVMRNGAEGDPYFTLGLVGPPQTPNVRIAGDWLKGR